MSHSLGFCLGYWHSQIFRIRLQTKAKDVYLCDSIHGVKVVYSIDYA